MQYRTKRYNNGSWFVFPLEFLKTASWNHLDWKGPLRSSNSNINTTMSTTNSPLILLNFRSFSKSCILHRNYVYITKSSFQNLKRILKVSSKGKKFETHYLLTNLSRTTGLSKILVESNLSAKVSHHIKYQPISTTLF